MDRRTFLFNSAAAAVGAVSASALAAAASARLPIRKAVEFSMLPKRLSAVERLRLAKECGFEAVEIGTQEDPRIAEEYKKASDEAGLPIHSVMNMGHWDYPLSSPDPEVVARCLKGMETSLDNAKLWGAQTVLLVPGVVTPATVIAGKPPAMLLILILGMPIAAAVLNWLVGGMIFRFHRTAPTRTSSTIVGLITLV